MRSKNLYLLNVVITIVTCFVLFGIYSPCRADQLEDVQNVVKVVDTGLKAAAPAMAGVPWYLILLLVSDIATSILAAVVNARKREKV